MGALSVERGHRPAPHRSRSSSESLRNSSSISWYSSSRSRSRLGSVLPEVLGVSPLAHTTFRATQAPRTRARARPRGRQEAQLGQAHDSTADARRLEIDRADRERKWLTTTGTRPQCRRVGTSPSPRSLVCPSDVNDQALTRVTQLHRRRGRASRRRCGPQSASLTQTSHAIRVRD